MTESPEEIAKRLLPCADFCGGDVYDSEHAYGCAANYRPAIAAALAERDRHYAINVLPEKDRQYEQLKAERDNWKARFETMEGFWRDLKAELDEARKEPERLYYEYEQHLQTLNVENEELKAERDAAFVKGLKLARKIVHDHLRNPTVDGWYDAIQAEIDKAGE